MNSLESLVRQSKPCDILASEHRVRLSRHLRLSHLRRDEFQSWPLRRYAFLLGVGVVLLVTSMLSAQRDQPFLPNWQEQWIAAGMQPELLSHGKLENHSSIIVRLPSRARLSFEEFGEKLKERRLTLAESMFEESPEN